MLTLYYHPLSSFCWKVLIALEERGIAFTPRLVDLGDPADRAAFRQIWPLAKFPVLVDEASGTTLPESTIIIEYLDRLGDAPPMIPEAPDAALAVRLRDRLFDAYLHLPMQKLGEDGRRAEADRDPVGVAAAAALVRTAYDEAEAALDFAPWAMGTQFTLADCSAFPALFYVSRHVPLTGHPKLSAYLERLKTRPGVTRALEGAQPWMHLVPG